MTSLHMGTNRTKPALTVSATVAAIVMTFVSGAALASSPSGLRLVDSRDVTVSVVEAEIPPHSNKTVVPITLAWDPPSGAGDQLSGVTPSVIVAGVSAKLIPTIPATGLTVSKKSRIPLFIEVADVAEAGQFIGAVVVEVAGHIQQLATIEINKSPGPDVLSIIGATNGTLSLTSERAAISTLITVFNSSFADLVVTTEMSDLRSATGVDTAVTITIPAAHEGSELTQMIKAGRSQTLQLTAAIEELGEYRGHIAFVVGNRRSQPVAIVITRTINELPIIITGDPVKHEMLLTQWSDTSATSEIDVTDTQGKPRILTLERGRIRLSDNGANTGTITGALEVSCQAPEATDAVPTAELQETTCRLGAKDTETLTATFTQLPGPGQYVASLRVGTADHPEKNIDLTISVRRSIWHAMALIAVGLLSSYFVRSRLTKSLRHSTRELAFTRLRESYDVVKFPSRDSYRPVQTAFVDRFNKLATAIQDEAPNFEEMIDSATRQVDLLPHWLRLTSRADAANREWNSELLYVQQLLVQESMKDTEVATARDKLLIAEQWLIVQLEIAPSLQKLAISVQTWIDEIDPGAETSARITQLIEESRGAAAGNDIAKAESTGRAALSAWFEVLAGSLLAESNASYAPGLANFEEWKQATALARRAAQVIQRFEYGQGPSQAWLEYRGAQLALTIAQSKWIANDARERIAADPPPQDPQKKALGKALSAATKAQRFAATDDLKQGRAALKEAIQQWLNGQEILQEATSSIGLIEGVIADGPPPPTRAPDTVGGQQSRLRRKIKRLSSAIDAAAIALAVPVGLFALYGSNATWGRWPDLSLAVLWGFGIAASFQFAGLAALRKQLVEEATTS